jgi:predicted phosphohydrolase
VHYEAFDLKKLAWLTDIHLNFLKGAPRAEFFRTVAQTNADAVLISGDIGEAWDFPRHLRDLARTTCKPVYFVLGNHDFYRSSIAAVRTKAADLVKEGSGVCWLSQAGAVELTPTTALIGHEGWADGRYGDYDKSLIMLNDFELIDDLTLLPKDARRKVLERMGDQAARHIYRALSDALQKYRRVILLTHVPPFREACWHEGAISSDNWLPHMSCKAVGDVILECMAAHPRSRIMVLCGHTHGSGECRPQKNIRVLTGAARYGAPVVQRTLRVV